MRKKKILSLLLALTIIGQVHTVFSYDESGAITYITGELANMATVEDFDESEIEIITTLVDTYAYTEEEAQEFVKTYRSEFVEALERNATDDNKTEETINAEEIKKNETEITRKKDLLSQLKIIDEDEYNYETGVLRGKFAEYIANLISYSKDYQNEKGYFEFNDVTQDSEYYPAVSLLVNKGTVIGIGEGLYSPETAITVNQACAIAVRLMGYDLEKMPEDENDVFYYAKATEINLLDGIETKSTDILTGEDAVTFLYNLLDTNVYELIMTGSEVFAYNDGTFISKYMNVEWIEDVVSANSKTSLTSSAGAVGKGQLRVGEIIFDFDDSKIDLDAFLGKRVRIYYSEDNPDEAIAIMASERYNIITTVEAGDIERFDITENRLYYEENDEIEYFDIKPDASIIFNGYAVDYTYDKQYLFTPDVGEITFLSNDRDDNADIILITSYVYYALDRINSDVPTLSDSKGVQAETIDLDKYDVTVYYNDTEINYAAIPQDSLVMVAPQRMKLIENGDVVYFAPDLSNSNNLTLEVVTDTVIGSVNGRNSLENTINIEGADVKLSKSIQKFVSIFPDNKFVQMPSIGTIVSIQLDKYGNAAYITVTSYAEGLKYAYAKKIYMDEENYNGEERYVMKLYSEDGEHLKIPLAQKVNVHKKWSDEAVLSKNTYYRKRITDFAVSQLDVGTFKPQVIRYALNADGEIKEIYIADKSFTVGNLKNNMNYYVDDDVFMCSFKIDNASGTAGKTYEEISAYAYLQYWYTITTDTVRFRIPYDVNDENSYSIRDYSRWFTNIDQELYGVSAGGAIGCMVEYVEEVPNTGTYKDNPTYAVITKDPVEFYDEATDEIKYSVELYGEYQVSRTLNKGAYSTATFSRNDLISYTYYLSDKKTKDPAWAHLSEVPISDLKKGDVVVLSMSKDKKDVIDGFGVIARDLGKRDSVTNQPLMGSWSMRVATDWTRTALNVDWINDNLGSVVLGKCKRFDDDYYYFDDGLTNIWRRFELQETQQFDYDVFVVYDAEKNLVYPGTVSDIKVGSYVLTCYDRLAVIIRNY